MAKRKHHKKHHTTKRRRVSGIGIGGDGMKLVIGAIAGAVVGQIAKSKLTSVDDTIKGGGMVVVGLLGAKSGNSLMKGAALGFGAVGGLALASKFLPAGTIGAVDYSNDGGRILGFDNYPNNPARNAIAGFNANPNQPNKTVISGVNSGVKYMSGAGMLG